MKKLLLILTLLCTPVFAQTGVENTAALTEVKSDTGLTILNEKLRAINERIEGFSGQAIDGSQLVGLANIAASAGIIPLANLGTGTPSSSTYLSGDGSWATFPTSSYCAIYTSSGSSTWTAPAGVTATLVVLLSGGGGGGGSAENPMTHDSAGGGGGGAGGLGFTLFPVTPGNSYTVTVGAGGTGGVSADGSNGGATSFSTFSVTGGNYGNVNGGATPGVGGIGGGISPLIGASGEDGGVGAGGDGGSTPYGGTGGTGGGGTDGNGGDASGYGAGGGGANKDTGSGKDGGDGSSGFAIVCY